MTNSIKKPHLDLLLIKKINKLEVKAHTKKKLAKPTLHSPKKINNWWTRLRIFFRKLFLKS